VARAAARCHPAATVIRNPSFRAGLRDGAPFAVASSLLALSFGVVAREAGFSVAGAVLMSAIVFAGSAQFAAVGILAAGGGVGASLGAAALMNSRFLPMGIALAPSLPGGPLWRAAQGQPVVDSSWAMALRDGGRFDRLYLFGHSAVQYVGWNLGTTAGAFAGQVLADPRALGLDAIFPAFFVAIIASELRDRAGIAAALGGAAIAVALLTWTPPGVPVLAASLAAGIGLHHRAARR
jgi:predicted branched-subunit amino acid permease